MQYSLSNMREENSVWDAIDQKYWSHFGAPSSLAEHVNLAVVAIVLTLSLVLNAGTLVVYLKYVILRDFEKNSHVQASSIEHPTPSVRHRALH